MIGLTVKEIQKSNLGIGSPMDGRREFRGEANLKRCVLSFKWNVDKDNELWVSGGSSTVLEQ